MSWENILKRATRRINYDFFKDSVEQAIAPYETFTLDEIYPLVRRIYQEKLIAAGENEVHAGKHASTAIKRQMPNNFTRVIHTIGTHRKTNRLAEPNTTNFIYERVE